MSQFCVGCMPRGPPGRQCLWLLGDRLHAPDRGRPAGDRLLLLLLFLLLPLLLLLPLVLRLLVPLLLPLLLLLLLLPLLKCRAGRRLHICC
jgi:hypothetical protein